MCRHCAGIAARGYRVVRWFLLCDGRSGIRFTPAGTPVGPDDRLFADIDAALEAAAACGLQVVFVLLDFLWFGAAAPVGGVQVRGRGRVVAGDYGQRALRRRVLRPLLRRYGRSPAVLAWDIVNEPEWATRGMGSAAASLPFRTMASRHCTAKLSASKASSANQKVGTPLGSRNALAASICFFSPLQLT
jgi:hypothetical protein